RLLLFSVLLGAEELTGLSPPSWVDFDRTLSRRSSLNMIQEEHSNICASVIGSFKIRTLIDHLTLFRRFGAGISHHLTPRRRKLAGILADICYMDYPIIH